MLKVVTPLLTAYTFYLALALSNFRLNLRDRNQYFCKLGPSASLRTIRMCLRPKLDNSNNALASSEALGCASCHLLCLCIIAILNYIFILKMLEYIYINESSPEDQPKMENHVLIKLMTYKY